MGKQTTEITPQGLVWQSRSTRSEIPWELVRDIEDTPNHLYLRCGGTSALVVPRRSFPTEAGYKSFISEARAYRAAAPNYLSTCPQCSYSLRDTTSFGCPECGWGRPHDPGV